MIRQNEELHDKIALLKKEIKRRRLAAATAASASASASASHSRSASRSRSNSARVAAVAASDAPPERAATPPPLPRVNSGDALQELERQLSVPRTRTRGLSGR